ncbi:hypothetical protein UlMin_002790 [Ulmus minor]
MKNILIYLSLILHIMDLLGPMHYFLLIFLGLGLLLGSINVSILFAIIFMNGLDYSNEFTLWTIGDGVTLLVCISIFFFFFFLLMTTITDTSWYKIIWTTRSNQIIEQDLISNSQQIGIHLSTYFFLPFEFISIIL